VTPETNNDSLPPKLKEILAGLSDPDFSTRLEKVYMAAAHAVARLTDMDLLRYESNQVEEQASADLSLWEEMAPVIRDTVMDVNALLVVIRATFPEEEPTGGIGQLLAEAVSSQVVEAGLDFPSRVRAAESALSTAQSDLVAQVTKLGETLRSPSVMSDRWNLLTEIQAFRTRFRELIGNLVFHTSSPFDYIQRKEVVPGHVEEVRSAITVRATTADLIRVLAARRQKVVEAESEDVQWNAQQLEKEMDTFGRTAAYRALRAQDKRALIEFRQRLRGMVMPAKAELEGLVDEYTALIQSLVGTLNPDFLRENDREVWAQIGVGLEQAQSKVETAPVEAAEELASAARLGQGLYGRDGKLDAFLRKSRKAGLAGLQGPELSATLDVYRELLANLAVHEG
jgi:hypothetical protein